MKVADLGEELKECASEREALKLAMRILEEENQRFHDIISSASQVVRNVKTTTPTRRVTPSPNSSHSRHSSKSSSSIPISPSIPGSPHAGPQYLIPAESSPWADNTAYPEKTPAVADFPSDKEIVQPRPGTRSLPPSLDADDLADSPSTPYYSSEPGKGASNAQLTT